MKRECTFAPSSGNEIPNKRTDMMFIACLKRKAVIWCNTEMEDGLRYSLCEMKAMGPDFFKELIHPQDYPRSLNIRHLFIAGLTKFRNICRIRPAKKKQWRWSDADITVKERDNEGQPIKIIARVKFWNKGETPMDIEALHKARTSFIPIIHKLTKCERQLLPYVAAGVGDKRIAADLCKSQKTIKTHVKHIMEKLYLHKRTKLVALLKEFGY